MTTVLLVRNQKEVVMIADSQATFGNVVLKSTAKKLRRLHKDKIIAGFAGSTADSLALCDRLETKIDAHPGQLLRACVELAKDWRTSKYLRQLEAMLIVTDKSISLLVTGNGDVVEPEHNIAAIGSGGPYAFAASRALVESGLDLDAETIAYRSMDIAASMCIYTNSKFTMEKIIIE